MSLKIKRTKEDRHAAEQLAVKFPALLIIANRVASSVFVGAHGRKKVGNGEAFWQFRRYERGDPIANINWRQSARTDAAFISEKERENAQSIWLWCDHSLSMDYNSLKKLPKKNERAVILLLALTCLLCRSGERVALLNSGLSPETGEAALFKIFSLLEKNNNLGGNLPRTELLPRDARVVLISDFFSELADLEIIINSFAQNGIKGHLLQVMDPAEEALRFSGRAEFQGLEGEQSVNVPLVESIRGQYLKQITTHRTNLIEICQRAGWTFNFHHTHEPPDKALMSLYLALGKPLNSSF